LESEIREYIDDTINNSDALKKEAIGILESGKISKVVAKLFFSANQLGLKNEIDKRESTQEI